MIICVLLGGDNISFNDLLGEIMMTTISDDEPRELRKAVEAIHIAGKLNLMQKKIFNNLVYYAYHELQTAEVHQISAAQLFRDVGFDSHNTKVFKDNLRGILNTKIEINVLRNGGDVWRASALLAEVEIADGVVSYSFPPRLRKALNNPTVFSIINLHMQKRFSSNPAYSLYENTFRFKNVNSTGFISVDVWKTLLGIDPEAETYKDFKYFNAQVLKPARKEVNEVTDITITPEFQKLGKQVVAIRFAVESKEAHKTKFVFPSDDQLRVEVLARMLALGITEKTAYIYISKHPIEYIEGNLAVVETRINDGSGKIKNYPAYFKKAIEDDFRPITPPIDKEIDKRKSDALEIKQTAKQAADDAVKIRNQQLVDARIYYEALSQEQQKDVELNFAAFISTSNIQLYTKYMAKGLDGTKLVRSAFDHWVADQINATQSRNL